MSDWKHKVVLITGGTSGIGRETAVLFGEQGAKVVVAGRREKEGTETADRVKKAGGEGLFVRADVSNEADAKLMVETTLKHFGRLDAAFNNAGIEGEAFVPVVEQTESNYREVMDINVAGVLWSMKYEIPAMMKSGGGSIVNNASVIGSVVFAGMSVYAASKHAVLGLTKAAAVENSKLGVRVNSVSPGVVVTPMSDRLSSGGSPTEALGSLHPIGRVGQPREIANAVLWLCSPAAAFVTGHDLKVDGGFTAV